MVYIKTKYIYCTYNTVFLLTITHHPIIKLHVAKCVDSNLQNIAPNIPSICVNDMDIDPIAFTPKTAGTVSIEL